MSSNLNGPNFDPEDRRKHLEFVQAVIARLSQSSATAKGWSLTIAGAAFGFSALNEVWYLSLLGLAVILSFVLSPAACALALVDLFSKNIRPLLLPR